MYTEEKEKYNIDIKVLGYLQTQRLFNGQDNENLKDNIIQLINNSIEKEEIQLKIINNEHLNFEKKLLNIPKMKYLSNINHKYIFFLQGEIVVGLLKSKRDNKDRYLYRIPIIFVNENFRNIGIGETLLKIYFNEVVINKRYQINLDSNQIKYIDYFKKFGFEVIEEESSSKSTKMIKISQNFSFI